MLSPSASQRTQWVDALLRFLIFFAAAAASFNGFFDKWSLRDEIPIFSIEKMLDGTAARPFVYRQMVPYIANQVQAATPTRLQQRFMAKMNSEAWSGKLFTGINSKVVADPRYMLRYHVVYYLSFFFLFASLFAMRRACLNIGLDGVSSSVAPVVFALFFPFLETVGGYFYDLSELFFLIAALAVALGRRYWLLVPITVLGTWNKESFLIFLPALFPLLRTRLSLRDTSFGLGLLAGLSLFINILVHQQYSHNPGGGVEVHWLDNIHDYLYPPGLINHEINYGIVTLKGYSVVTLLLLAVLIARGWRGLPIAVRHHTYIAAAINLPLFFLLCAFGELRDLSLLYGALLLLIATAIAQWVRREGTALPETHTSDLQGQSEPAVPAAAA